MPRPHSGPSGEPHSEGRCGVLCVHRCRNSPVCSGGGAASRKPLHGAGAGRTACCTKAGQAEDVPAEVCAKSSRGQRVSDGTRRAASLSPSVVGDSDCGQPLKDLCACPEAIWILSSGHGKPLRFLRKGDTPSQSHFRKTSHRAMRRGDREMRWLGAGGLS